MYKIMVVPFLVFSHLLACGTDPFKKESNSPAESGPSPTTSNGETSFKGFVNSAFELTVDGEKYGDMEDFYTKEVSRLPSKVATAGYDSSWKVSFDAQVGMNDLWQDMKVYIAPNTNRGYQGEGTVGKAGGFAITLPPAALDSEYRVRAVKRVSVLLTKENQKVRICYNFSANEKAVLFSDREKPIVLDNFATNITAYDCQTAESGLKIPSASTSEGTVPALKLRKGGSKDDVVAVLGLKSLFVASSIRWCWTKTDAKAEVCANVSYDKCQCYVEFNDIGKVESQQNIRGDLLDLTTW